MLADLDGDGDLDLATDGISIFRNDGQGGLEEVAVYSGEPRENGVPIIATDLDADGDLVTDQVSVLRNNGEGAFADPVLYPVYTGRFSGGYLVATDLNHDGKVDLAVATAPCNCRPPSPVEGVQADLNGDGVPDLAVGTESGFAIVSNATPPPVSLDRDRDGVPDECDAPPRRSFHRGDPNSSGITDISDGVFTLNYLFLGREGPACIKSADVQNEGAIDISDGIYLLSWLFTGGPEPAAPGPPNASCGVDPDAPGSVGDLGCESYPGC